MKDGIVDFPTYPYLRWRFVWAALLFIGGIYLIVYSRAAMGIFLIFLGLLASTARYGIRVDTVKKTWFDYFSIFGLKRGETKSYATIDYVFIKPSKQSQTMNSQVSSTTIKSVVFDAYLKFDQDEKVYLLTEAKKKDVLNFAERLAKSLNVSVVDHTVGVVE